jgi:hypothetical protein
MCPRRSKSSFALGGLDEAVMYGAARRTLRLRHANWRRASHANFPANTHHRTRTSAQPREVPLLPPAYVPPAYEIVIADCGKEARNSIGRVTVGTQELAGAGRII